MPSKRTVRLAKLTQPRFHAPLQRTRLFKLLDEGKRPIVWISGPAGSGKTTLAASYLEARKAKTFWFQVDAGDRDPASLFHYLAELAAQLRGKQQASLPHFEAEYQASLPHFTRQFFRELFRRFGAGSILVLDNCHDAASDTFHSILREACAEIPDGCRCIAISRAAAPAELSREIASKRLQEVAWPQLRLSDAEAQAIAKTNAQRVGEAAVTLNHQCDGWVGGLVLLLSRGARGDQATCAFEAKQAVFDYFAEEVFARAAPETQTMLLSTALLPYTTVSMASSLSTLADAEKILNALYRDQYFVERRVEGELVYQYHDLFREFLLSRLQKTYTCEQLASLRRRAAEMLEQAQRLPEATELYKRAGDWRSLAALIRANAEQHIDQGRWQTVQGWFDGGADHLPSDDPELLLWHGMSLVPRDPAGARGKLERAYAEFRAAAQTEGMVRATLALTDLAYVFGEALDETKRIAAALEPIFANAAPLPVAVMQQACKVYLDTAIATGASGGLVEATVAALKEQLRSAELNTDQQMGNNEELLLYSIFAADERLGIQASGALQQLAQREDASPTRRYWGVTMLGLWRQFRAEADCGVQDFARAIELADTWRMGMQSTVARVHHGLALYRCGETEPAVRELSAVTGNGHAAGPLYDTYLAWAATTVAAARSDFEQATTHAAAMISASRASHYTLLETIAWCLRASYALRLDRTTEASLAVREARRLIGASVYRRYDALLTSIEAELAWKDGDHPRALTLLRSMLGLTRNRIIAACLVELAPWLNRQLAQAFAADIEAPAARALVADFDLAPDNLTDANWPWHVRVRTLGAFQVEVSGEPIHFSGKAPKKTLALLQAIIALGGRDVLETALIDALWPDSEGDAGREALKIALRRLRKLLGAPETVEWRQGRLRLSAQRVWVDAFAFEAAVQRALGSGEAHDCDRALRLYAGNFLPSDGREAWPVLARERLARKFGHLVAQHGQALEQRGDYAAAEQVYLRGLDADNLAEPFYQGLMRCHLARGRYSDGMNVFRRLRQQLSVTLNIDPSRESLSLFQALQRPASAALS